MQSIGGLLFAHCPMLSVGFGPFLHAGIWPVAFILHGGTWLHVLLCCCVFGRQAGQLVAVQLFLLFSFLCGFLMAAPFV